MTWISFCLYLLTHIIIFSTLLHSFKFPPGIYGERTRKHKHYSSYDQKLSETMALLNNFFNCFHESSPDSRQYVCTGDVCVRRDPKSSEDVKMKKNKRKLISPFKRSSRKNNFKNDAAGWFLLAHLFKVKKEEFLTFYEIAAATILHVVVVISVTWPIIWF